MPDQNSFSACNDELKKLFDAAANADQNAIEQLTQILGAADPATATDWTTDVARFWTTGLETFAKNAMAMPAFNQTTTNLIKAMLAAALDTALLRNLYEALAKQVFAGYGDFDGLIEALGLKHEDVNLARISLKWNVWEATSVGSFCYGKALGIGKVTLIDDISNEIKLACIRKQTLSIKSYMETTIVIKKDSIAHRWLSKTEQPSKMPADELNQAFRDSVVTATTLPMNLPRALLVPGTISDAILKNLTSNVAKKTVTHAANEQEATSETNAPTSDTWDKARDIKELSERLKTACNFEKTPDTDLANVVTHLRYAAVHPEHAGLFAFSLAVLYEHKENYADWMDETIKELAEIAEPWKDEALFADTSDKLTGKQVPAWFQATRQAMGSTYLVERVFTLPHKLWGHAERTLDSVGEHSLLHDMADNKLAEGKASADMLYWVWKLKNDDLRQKYLTKATFLFKTLLKEVKGSYLKAQRDLRHLLISDETFQRTIMNNGDENAIAELVRCAKKMTLLDGKERQSLLVGIVRIFPNAKKLVEDKKSTDKRAVLQKISSIRSIKALQQELNDIVSRQIPENIKAIEVARSYGDLRENSEFKYAKEQQRFLAQRRSDFEHQLSSIQPTDFREANVNGRVIPGCTVVLAYDAQEEEKTFHILGLLDTNGELNMISYDTPLGKAIIGHDVGDKVELHDHSTAVIKEVKPLTEEMLQWLSADPDPIV